MNLRNITRLMPTLALLLGSSSASAFAQGELEVWGADNYQQLSSKPAGSDFTSVACGYYHSVGLRSDGSLLTWGRELYNEVSDTPADSDFVSVAAGGFHALAIRNDGSLVSWGRNIFGQVSNTPSGTGFERVASGEGHSLAIRIDGSIAAWGWDSHGQVSGTPTGFDFTQVDGGGKHSVALRANGTLVAWGPDDGSFDDMGQVTDTPIGSDFQQVAAGRLHSLALRSDGSLISWGRDVEGQVSGTPPGSGFVSIECGLHHSLALRADGSLAVWGMDFYGQVSNTPSGSGYWGISAGLEHSVALKNDQPAAPACIVGWSYDPAIGRRMFTTNAATPTDSWQHGGNVLSYPKGIDYDANGATLYGVNHSTSMYGELDQATGAFTLIGSTGVPPSTLAGITAHPDGVSWFAVSSPGPFTGTQIWHSASGLGAFTPLGPVLSGRGLTDIACDSNGNLFATDIVQDVLCSINPADGSLSVIGPLGFNLQYGQGCDFDWADDTLYALVSTIDQDCFLASIDTVTGVITNIENVSSNALQGQIAIKVHAPLDIVAFCDPAEPNSTLVPTQIQGSTCASGLHLEATNGPPGRFGYFLVGTALEDPGTVLGAGRLCLSQAVGEQLGRYSVAGGALTSIGQFDSFGVLQNLSGTSTIQTGFDVPLTLPFVGSPSITSGQTWFFQLWYRDNLGGPGTSNLSNGLQVTF